MGSPSHVLRYNNNSGSTALKHWASAADLMPLAMSSNMQETPCSIMIAEEVGAEAKEEEEAQDLCFGQLYVELVGTRHFRGVADSGEAVLLIRHPLNPYDRNAILVKNMNRITVGYLPRGVASKLSPLMDQKQITIEGTVKRGRSSVDVAYAQFVSVHLRFYGRPQNRSKVLPKLPSGTRIMRH
ncbi:HIRAN-domain-containing protein [Coprinellus micaceus]|uniref:HIRAN-domain-containing protein n=1 Tax=Coprinellus micaceus TaxID=71717 RepID=A0A4Y7TUQ1_COPMI|nr:HIRAN-domain-containing protein [Coprinellus micaceus]